MALARQVGMMMVVVMVMPVCERWAGEHGQEQNSRKYFLHESNPNMVSIACGDAQAVRASKVQRPAACARIR
jgi:hypothetical protein